MLFQIYSIFRKIHAAAYSVVHIGNHRRPSKTLFASSDTLFSFLGALIQLDYGSEKEFDLGDFFGTTI